MKLAFVVDPLGELKAYKDSSIAMMREAARRGQPMPQFGASDAPDALAASTNSRSRSDRTCARTIRAPVFLIMRCQMAFMPVISIPVIRRWISCVPS